MKTVREFIKENKLKAGDKLTDGVHTWIIQEYTHRAQRESLGTYLKGEDNNSPIVAGASLHLVVIPNLRRAPKRINVYKWVYQMADGSEPRVSESRYPDSTTFKEYAEKFHDAPVLWYKRLDECMETIEVACPC